MTAKRQDISFFGLDMVLKGESNRHRDLMIFDWNKAAILIKNHPKYPDVTCEAGLSGDWDYTGGVIFDCRSIVKNNYTYLSSTWATPTLIIDDDEYPCFVMESETNWGSDTKWPEESVKILAE